MLTAITAPGAKPALNAPGRDLRPAVEQTPATADTLNAREFDEVAEAPAHPRPNSDGRLIRDRSDPTTP